MASVKEDVLAALAALGIAYDILEHAPVHTMEDCKAAEEALGGVMPKNLFLTPRNHAAHHLLIARADAPFRTALISRQLGVSRLSFATAEELMDMLRTLPGAISPMGLIFDPEKKVRLAVDRALREQPRLLFHPCVNTATLAMSGRDFFETFLPALGREPVFVDMRGEETHEV
ncbi:MAG TPA: prolyl-tRNA synthetase associated domain-containing protein [Candidatus Pullichristensenella avicola]|nr:prolyl-tRNA synthetase associated domain-containing protein [Candidatus Pullichristensenella avicola]